MKSQKNDSISKVMNDSELIRELIQSEINDALLKHKQAGNPVCELQDGKVVWISPDKIIVKKNK